ncbi:DUF5076 domain-containing protein [Sphingopyxis sp.]|jgi:hypothetical protein|uniref:DUF5076 domain-containing protein n=1 Tax=Sphingopyxis sp. TaxID=1908224 RepID=UPI001DB57B0D|nr:DUF5076 domain-containing protein [Sphingopyxis sp.]MBW8294923.1 DUF5076 domain-containing protein [Sphingopyxis sp.]
MDSPPISGRIADELLVDDCDFFNNSVKVVQMWVENKGPATCIIQPERWATPEMCAMLMVDAVRHGARAFAQPNGTSESEMLDRIWLGLDAERDDPKTVSAPLTNCGELN